jgi:excisionase family DNA binding protein
VTGAKGSGGGNIPRMAEDATSGSSGHPATRRVSVDQAARALGLSVDAVRKRVQRGTIPHEKDGAGRVRIILDGPDIASTLRDESPDTTGQPPDALIAAKDETIGELRDRVEALERQLDARQEEIRRRDILLANLVERVPQLEAPQAPRDAPRAAGGGAEGQEGPFAEEDRPERSWWRRWFGFE